MTLFIISEQPAHTAQWETAVLMFSWRRLHGNAVLPTSTNIITAISNSIYILSYIL